MSVKHFNSNINPVGVRFIVLLAVGFLFSFAPSESWANKCEGQLPKLQKQKASGLKSISTQGGLAAGAATAAGDNTHGSSVAQGNVSRIGAAGNAAAAKLCAGLHKKCKQAGCADDKCNEFKSCAIGGAQAATQSAQDAGQADAASAASAALPAAMMAAMAAMMAKKKKKKKKDETPKEEDPPKDDPDEPTDPGDVACLDQAEGYLNSDCYSDYVNTCFTNMNANKCGDFKDHYCPASGQSIEDSSAPGKGSQFCTFTAATDFCANSDNRFTPACLWIASRGIVCETNPMSPECFPKYTLAELTAACAGLSGDPLCDAALNGGLMLAGDSSNPASITTASTSPGSTYTTASVGFERAPASVGGTSIWSNNSDLLEEECEDGTLLECGANVLPEHLRQVSEEAQSGYL